MINRRGMNRPEKNHDMDALEQTHDVIGVTMIPAIGFGEAASAFIKGLKGTRSGLHFRSYDIKTDASDRDVSDSKWRDYSHAGVSGQADMAGLLRGAELVLSMVPSQKDILAEGAIV